MVVYRKYRPAKFSDFLGADLVKSALLNSITKQNFHSSYLFSGPRGTGKTSLARLFAKGICCTNFLETGDVCNCCNNCVLINSGVATDIVEIDAASNRGIDDIRDLRDSVNYRPVVLQKKIYIIDEVHMLTTQAFNALLKTLEEPPEDVIFILATTEIYKVPITILSRAVRFELKLQPKDVILSKLKTISRKENFAVQDFVLEKIYRISGGSFRDAETVFSKILSLNKQFLNEQEVDDFLGIPSKENVQLFIDILVKIICAQENIVTSLQDHIKSLSDILVKVLSINIFLEEVLTVMLKMLNEKNIQNDIFITISSVLLEVKKDISTLPINLVPVAILEKLVNSQYLRTELNLAQPSLLKDAGIYSGMLQKNISQEIITNNKNLQIGHNMLDITENQIDIHAFPHLVKSILLRSSIQINSANIHIQVKSDADKNALESKNIQEILKKKWSGKTITISLSNQLAKFDNEIPEVLDSVENNSGEIYNEEASQTDNSNLVKKIFSN
jgi:DNA polymerase III subunit gamma/tau